MVFIGPISSVFDFLTFFVLLRVFHAGQALFQTGWFVESLCTQTLVLFVIRTYERPWRSRPSRALASTPRVPESRRERPAFDPCDTAEALLEQRAGLRPHRGTEEC
jgi:hypothetical protein